MLGLLVQGGSVQAIAQVRSTQKGLGWVTGYRQDVGTLSQRPVRSYESRCKRRTQLEPYRSLQNAYGNPSLSTGALHSGPKK